MTHRILHIFCQSNSESEQFEQTLREQGWESQVATDCYMGLAELVRRGSAYFDCVILRFNDLATGEEEFFPMVFKLAPGAPVYFYGQSSGGVTTETARLHGARGPIDVHVLRSAFGDATQEPPPHVPSRADEVGTEPPPAPPPAGESPPRLSDDELEALLGEDQE